MNKLAIIVPYRDREESLKNFLYVLPPHMKNSNVFYHIYIIEQTVGKKFNKGKVCNVGFLVMENGFTHVAFNDVDLMPAETAVYTLDDSVYHVSPLVEQKSFSPTSASLCGGVILFPVNKFRQINGFDNDYWGWGAEDEDIAFRCSYHNIPVVNTQLNVFFSTPHEKESRKTHNKNLNRMMHHVENPHEYKKNGLDNCSYSIISIEKIGGDVTHVTVDI